MDREMAEVLVRTGAGTPMGELMRRYWVPVLLASEIAGPDCPPVRVKILGEKLLAFRDSEGRAGLIDEFCAHRGVSLFFGRNEECGIRCSYHGWKYDIHGQCVDLPAAPQVAPKMSIKAYPCVERGGVLWAYMGPPQKKPSPPEIEWCLLPDSHRFVSKRLQECNYLQAMEGGIDTQHVSFVHRYEVDKDPMHQRSAALKYIKADRNVEFDVEQTPHGLTIYGRRNGEADTYYWRITQWLFPWYTLIPPFGDHPLGGHVWVPIDDENCWAWSINFLPDRPLSAEERNDMLGGRGIHVKYEPGSFRPLANKDNDYLVDRASQKEKRTYSGIAGFAIQDASLQESMGPIQDHAREHLMATDKGIVMARKMLHEAAQGLAKGIEPPALDAAAQRVRSAAVMLARGEDPARWARDSLRDGLEQPVVSV
ncbi:MAG: aromatic ring-hydroxylating dioxygenase subunit alpha [Betaproteobacteria bacterium]|nr:aromatic ring-hydroxylating dioxygenase subunit alpha [Betaproteobacteria bacterium]